MSLNLNFGEINKLPPQNIEAEEGGRIMELFNSSQFSSLDDDALRDFEVENVSSKKKAVKRTQPKLDPAWDDGSAFPEVSSLDFEIGDRIVILFPKKYAEELGHICGYHTEGSPEVWVKLDNQDLQIRGLSS